MRSRAAAPGAYAASSATVLPKSEGTSVHPRCRPIAWVLIPWLALMSLLVSAPATAGGVPAEVWRTIETEHFRVHYHRGVAAIAEDVAVLCEQAHAALVPYFGFEPPRRTHVVLMDEADFANGFASVVPFNRMTLLAVPPESDGTRGDTDHWMYELIVHEYAHVLHLAQLRGLPRLINVPLGRQYTPNQQLPRWIIEGVATALESHFTGGGRVRSHTVDAYLRAIFAEDTVPTLAQLSNDPPRFPYANAWYLLGSHFITWIAETRGWDTLPELFRIQAGRLQYMAVNYLALRAFGETFDTLYAEWREHTRASFEEEERALRAAGLVEPEVLTSDGFATRWVVWDPVTERVGWVRADGEDDPAFVWEDDPDSRRARLGNGAPIALVPGGEALIHSHPTLIRGFYAFRDLWLVSTRDGSRRRLGRGYRAREPAVSPDGGLVAYVRPDEGRTDLWLLDLETGRHRRLVQADPWAIIAQPAFMPDGRSIVFSMLRVDVGRDLFKLDIASGVVSRLTAGRALDDYPAPSPDGRWIYFASDGTGVSNIYAIPADGGPATQVTRVTTGVFNPVVARQGDRCWVYMSRMSARGHDVARLPLAPDCSPLPVPAADGPDSYVRAAPPRVEVAVDAFREHRYRTGLEARPYTWTPVFERAGTYRQYGLRTSGADPADRLRWTLQLTVGEPYYTPRWTASVTTRRLYPDVTAYTYRAHTFQPSRVFVGSRTVSHELVNTVFGVETSVPFGGFRTSYRARLGWEYEDRAYARDLRYEHDPGDLTPRFPEYGRFNSLNVGFTASNLRGYVQSVSAERGSLLSVNLRIRSRLVGADYEGRELTFVSRHAVPIHRWSKHAIAFQLTGGTILSSQRDRPAFFIGGLSEQDLVQAVLNLTGTTGGRAIRGYSPGIRSGQQFLTVNSEYRFPIVRMDFGVSTLPLIFERFHGAVFVDAGTAFDDPADLRDLQRTLLSFGAELRLDVRTGYFIPMQFRLGLARGLGVDGQTQWYVLYGTGF